MMKWQKCIGVPNIEVYGCIGASALHRVSTLTSFVVIVVLMHILRELLPFVDTILKV